MSKETVGNIQWEDLGITNAAVAVTIICYRQDEGTNTRLGDMQSSYSSGFRTWGPFPRQFTGDSTLKPAFMPS